MQYLTEVPVVETAAPVPLTIKQELFQILDIDSRLANLQRQMSLLMQQRDELTLGICYRMEQQPSTLLGRYNFLNSSIAVYVPTDWHQKQPEEQIKFIKIDNQLQLHN